MRPFVVLAILLSAAAVAVYYHCAKHGQNEAHVEQNEPITSMSSGAVHQAQAKNETVDTYNAGNDCLYRLYLFATIAGVCVALGGIYAIYRQTEATEESAKAAHDAAVAASDNAKALMNAERPWLVPKITRTVSQIESLHIKDQPRTLRNITYFGFWIRNIGRTPAQIVAVRGDPRLTYDGIDGGFTDPPDYGLPVVFRQIRILAPGEKWRTDDDINVWSLISKDEKIGREIKAQRVHYIFKGQILYRDSFNPEQIHETRFCYTYLEGIDDWHVSGPPEHTKYT